ncbi:MAG: glutamate racemase [Desulfovibrionaceae bacterium]|nr:glutamate racemase [Desulfovibrionaceae bacterium]
MSKGASLPIALFDSGMGGLTVFKAISQALPKEDLLYLGDTARLPYGTKGQDTIIRYTLKAAKVLADRGIKMLVVACNTATANALPALQEEFKDLTILGVVEPGARAAVKESKSGHILVIATEATIKSGVYLSAIKNLRKDALVSAKACTLFVALAEEGLMQGKIVEEVAHYYLDEIFLDQSLGSSPDTMILGCTHFPLLKPALEQVVGSKVVVVDPAATVAESVKLELKKQNRLQLSANLGQHHFMTTDNQERFARTGSLFLGRELKKDEIELVDL